MFGIIDKITEAIKNILIDLVLNNLGNMFGDVNTKVGQIAEEVGKTPQNWNSDIFEMIETLSETVILPIAGAIITFVLCYELITMITEKNNMHDIETFMFFKYIFKMIVAVFIVSHTFDIVIGIFEVAQHIVNGSSTTIGTLTNIDIASSLEAFEQVLQEMSIGGLLGLALETFLVSFFMKILSVAITVIIFIRMIEIYLYSSIAPIPFATFTNREWGTIGNNYLKGLFALGIQGFFIMVCVAIYAILTKNLLVGEDVHGAIWSIVAYTVVLTFSLFKSGALSKSVFNAT